MNFFRKNQNYLFLIIIVVFIARSAFSAGGILDDPVAYIKNILILIPGIVIGITVHEFAHAFSAYKLGDDTPKIQGRVTLNPLKHIDPFGFVCLLLGGFGWGKPVEVNPYNFKNRRRDDLITDVSGVLTNFIVAFIFFVILKIYAENMVYTTANYVIYQVLNYCVAMNLVLMIFNLIPIPPLDGFGIATNIFDLQKYSWYNMVYYYGSFILLAFIFFGFAGKIISPIISAIFELFGKICFW